MIIEKPTGPQLQAPAEAPTTVPIKLPLIFLVSLINLILNIFIDTTTAAKIDNITISEKLNAVSVYMEKTMNGSRNRYSETIDNEKNNTKKITPEITT